jgi:Inhibitor of Apoptosis domain
MDLASLPSETVEYLAQRPYQNLGKLNLNMNISFHRLFTFPCDYRQKTDVEPENFAEAGFYMAKDYSCIFCQFCHLEIKSLYDWRHLNLAGMLEMHQKTSPECSLFNETNNNVSVGITSSTLDYHYEAFRLYSLLKTNIWTYVSPYELAKGGFYYTYDDDNCR